jgi:ATP phosphoribosyltransferase regulatory subunit HisZ
MGQPLPPEAQGLMGPQSPISMEQLLQLRAAAMGTQDLSGAAQRRLGEPDPNAIVDGKSPEDLMLEQAAQDTAVDPPDINPESAKTMMMYGSVMDFLMRARGELSNG